jgi:hypothetical protein
MKNTLICISTLLLLIWMLGYFILHLSPEIHAVLMLAMIVFVRSIFAFNNDRPMIVHEDNDQH